MPSLGRGRSGLKRDSGWAALSWGMAGLLLALCLWSAARAERRAFTYFGLFAALALLPCVLRQNGGSLLRGPPRALLVFGISMNAFGWGWRWLDRIPLYDKAAHLVTTAGMVAVLPVFLPEARRVLRDAPRTFWMLLVGAGSTLGIIWETYEWGVDRYLLAQRTMSVGDTVTDLIADVAGAMFGAWLGVAWTRRATS